MTSTGSDLRNRIQQQRETVNQQIEETTQLELKTFRENLRSIVAGELNTIKNATVTATDAVRAEVERLVVSSATEIAKGRERIQADLQVLEPDTDKTSAKVHALLLRRWGVSLVTGLAFCLGIFIGSWGMMQWVSSEFRSQLELLLEVRQRVYEESGVVVYESNGRRLLALPRGMITEDGQSSIELFRPPPND